MDRKNATMKASVTRPENNKQTSEAVSPDDCQESLSLWNSPPEMPRFSKPPTMEFWILPQDTQHYTALIRLALEKLCQALEGLTELHHFEHVFVDQLPAAVRHLLSRATDRRER